MGQTLTNGLYLPDEGERYCYNGLASNWTILDAVVGGYNAHIENTTIHITSEERIKWNANVTQSYVLRYASSSVSANSTVAYSSLDNTDNIKIGDKVLDQDGKLYSVTSVDAANSQITVGALLIDLSKDSDLSNYYTKAEVDALDSNAMHKTGAETAAGIKTFSDETYIKSLNFTNEVASTSSSSSAVMPIITTITYSDSSPSQSARLNLRITADGIKSFYPHENNAYSLGLSSRSFSDFFSYHGYFRGQQQGDEYSGNARTNLTLTANRDTLGTSGCLIDTFRENTTQGTGSHIIGFGIKENSVRYEGCRFSWSWNNNLNGYVFSLRPNLQGANPAVEHNLGLSTDKWDKINGVEPSALSLPDLDNGIDISGYITNLNSNNIYTPTVNGYLSIGVASPATAALYVYDDTYGWGISGRSISNATYTNLTVVTIPVIKNQTINIECRSASSLVWAKFYPCLGNI